MFLKHFLPILLLFCISCISPHGEHQPNVLFIAVDDLRPDIGVYGNSDVKTPHLDKFASTGCVFESHYVSVPTCGASRYSLLTGRLPRFRQHLQNSAFEHFTVGQPEGELPESFIHHFRRNGYYTIGIGKISHAPDGRMQNPLAPMETLLELPHSWDELVFDSGKWGSAENAFFGYANGTDREGENGQVKPYESGDVDDKGYVDGLTAELAVQKLREAKKLNKPFFMGVGFFKPHLPFNAPKKYWDLYERDQLPTSPVPDLPLNVSLASLQKMGEFNRYKLGDEKATLEYPLSEAYARKLIQAYYAAISYVDAQIGKVLDELERQGLAENTIVVVWGDHGWHLGDHRVWGKHTLFEVALRSPLMIRIPGVSPKRISKDWVVSTVDLYPSLLEWCGLSADHLELDGQSLAPLITTNSVVNRENMAFSFFNNGISMRTSRYRLNRYFRDEEPVVELFDHLEDPHENRNVAQERPEIVDLLMPSWEKGDTGLYKPK